MGEPLATARLKKKIIEAVARAIYESHRLSKGWDHPQLNMFWKPSCRKAARAAIKTYQANAVSGSSNLIQLKQRGM